MKHISKSISRRKLVGLLAGGAIVALVPLANVVSADSNSAPTSENNMTDIRNLSAEDWKKRLTKEQYRVLRDEGTERSGSSDLNHEKRAGIFACAGCGQPLFNSSTKYESGTGWPSFYDPIAGAVDTRTDYKMLIPRTEYHCSKCEGHQGHVFNDGPKPTGKRYCNNGVALTFVPNETPGE